MFAAPATHLDVRAGLAQEDLERLVVVDARRQALLGKHKVVPDGLDRRVVVKRQQFRRKDLEAHRIGAPTRPHLGIQVRIGGAREAVGFKDGLEFSVGLLDTNKELIVDHSVRVAPHRRIHISNLVGGKAPLDFLIHQDD